MIAGPGEVMSHLGRAQRRIDSNEENARSRAEAGRQAFHTRDDTGVDSSHPAWPSQEGVMGDWHERQTMGLLPERAARLWGPREALAFQGRRSTFAELHADVDAAAKGLMALGIKPGDRVALWMVNRPEWLHAMFALLQIGAVLVPVNTRFRTADMTYVLGQSDAVATILAARSGPVDYLAMMREIAPGL